MVTDSYVIIEGLDHKALLSSIRKMNHKKDLYVGCIPCKGMKLEDLEFKDSFEVKCPVCEENMWTTIRKNDFVSKKKNRKLVCFMCIIVYCKYNDIEPPDPLNLVRIDDFQ